MAFAGGDGDKGGDEVAAAGPNVKRNCLVSDIPDAKALTECRRAHDATVRGGLDVAVEGVPSGFPWQVEHFLRNDETVHSGRYDRR